MHSRVRLSDEMGDGSPARDFAEQEPKNRLLAHWLTISDVVAAGLRNWFKSFMLMKR